MDTIDTDSVPLNIWCPLDRRWCYSSVYWPHSCVPVWKVCLRPHRDHFHVSNIVTSVTLDKIINIQTNYCEHCLIVDCILVMVRLCIQSAIQVNINIESAKLAFSLFIQVKLLHLSSFLLINKQFCRRCGGSAELLPGLQSESGIPN